MFIKKSNAKLPINMLSILDGLILEFAHLEITQIELSVVSLRLIIMTLQQFQEMGKPAYGNVVLNLKI